MELDLQGLQTRFSEASNGNPVLSRGEFKVLTLKLVKDSQQTEIPSDKDIETAFEVVDADKSGTVDFNEFITLYQLVKNGEVKGLSRKSMFGSSKKGAFTKSFKEVQAQTDRELNKFHSESETQSENNDVISEGPGTNVRVLNDVFELNDEVGKGAFSVVCRAKTLSSGEVVAVKITQKNILQSHEKASISNEFRTLSKCKDVQNVVTVLDFFEDDASFSLVTELVSGLNFQSYLSSLKILVESDVVGLARALLDALKGIHALSIAHRDVKPDNVMLRGETPETGIVLIDFGFAIEYEGCSLVDMCGTPAYAPPEMVSSLAYDSCCDIWSLGVLLFECLSGAKPFESSGEDELMASINAGSYSFESAQWANVSESGKDIVSQMLTVDHSQRPHAEDLLSHRWFASPPSEVNVRSGPTTHVEIVEEIRSVKEDEDGHGRTQVEAYEGVNPEEAQLAGSDEACIESVEALDSELDLPTIRVESVEAVDETQPSSSDILKSSLMRVQLMIARESVVDPEPEQETDQEDALVALMDKKPNTEIVDEEPRTLQSINQVDEEFENKRDSVSAVSDEHRNALNNLAVASQAVSDAEVNLKTLHTESIAEIRRQEAAIRALQTLWEDSGRTGEVVRLRLEAANKVKEAACIKFEAEIVKLQAELDSATLQLVETLDVERSCREDAPVLPPLDVEAPISTLVSKELRSLKQKVESRLLTLEDRGVEAILQESTPRVIELKISSPDQSVLMSKIESIRASLTAMEAGHSETMDLDSTVLDVEDALRAFLEERKSITVDQRNCTAAAMRSLRLASLWGKISGVMVRSTFDDASALERAARQEQLLMLEERAISRRRAVEWHRELYLRLQQVQLEKTVDNPRGSLVGSSASLVLPKVPTKTPPKEFGAIPQDIQRSSTAPRSVKEAEERTAILEGIDSLVGALRASRATATREHKLRLDAEARCAKMQAEMEAGLAGSTEEEVRSLQAELAATTDRCDRVTEAFTRLSAINVSISPTVAPSTSTQAQSAGGQAVRVNELVAEVESLKTAKRTLERHIMSLSADNQRMGNKLAKAQNRGGSDMTKATRPSGQEEKKGESEQEENGCDSTGESTDFTKYFESFLF